MTFISLVYLRGIVCIIMHSKMEKNIWRRRKMYGILCIAAVKTVEGQALGAPAWLLRVKKRKSLMHDLFIQVQHIFSLSIGPDLSQNCIFSVNWKLEMYYWKKNTFPESNSFFALIFKPPLFQVHKTIKSQYFMRISYHIINLQPSLSMTAKWMLPK